MNASRPIFIPDTAGNLVREVICEFEWFPGFSLQQKQKSIEALHQVGEHEAQIQREQIVEISTRSNVALGRELSAFNLQIFSNELGRDVPLEAAFQSSKVFAVHGRQEHLLGFKDGREIKARIKEFQDEPITAFEFEGESWDLWPQTAFYDFLYLKGLAKLMDEDERVEAALSQYQAFTDIEFNPKKSINCQARSCALFFGLGKLPSVSNVLSSKNEFVNVLTEHNYGVATTESPVPQQAKFF